MPTTRRHFLQTTAAAGLVLPGTAATSAAAKRVSANDRIQVATIGVGGMGTGDTNFQISQPAVELVGVCDLYDGRLVRAKERWGEHIFTTRDYREVLARKDVDAVIIATPDHWHTQIAIDALKAGKDVYLEKPMVQKIEEGKRLIDAAASSDRILQVGSQYVTSVIYRKVRELLKAGAIGELNLIEAWLDRDTAIGAWQYSIPPDASPQTIDWDRYLGQAPKAPFDPTRFFRWRNYQDYGTGVAGDLFVHLLSGVHFATGSLGPSRVLATGGLRYWKDGRDVPDVMLALCDYEASGTHPEFTLALRVNFKSSVSKPPLGLRFVGSEGHILVGDRVTLIRPPKPREPGHNISTFPEATQEKFLQEYRKKYPEVETTTESLRPAEREEFVPPRSYSAHLAHHQTFLEAVRSRKPVFEDAVFGFRAAGPALLSNVSYFKRKICHWDAESMTERA